MNKAIGFHVTKEYGKIVIENKSTDFLAVSLSSKPDKPIMIIPPGSFSIGEESNLNLSKLYFRIYDKKDSK